MSHCAPTVPDLCRLGFVPGTTAVSHQPQSKFGDGGRSPTISVVLVPSVTSVSRTFERLYSTPSLTGQRVLTAVPATPT